MDSLGIDQYSFAFMKPDLLSVYFALKLSVDDTQEFDILVPMLGGTRNK